MKLKLYNRSQWFSFKVSTDWRPDWSINEYKYFFLARLTMECSGHSLVNIGAELGQLNTRLGWILLLNYHLIIISISGRVGDHLHGGLHHRDVHQDTGSGLHAPQGKLHEKSLELHGLLCCDLWVSQTIWL